MERADACLYRAKETGRNRTCWENQEEDSELSDEIEAKEPESRVTEVNGVPVFAQEIEVSTSLQLTAMKLSAFIDASEVKVTHQEHGLMKLRSGSVGFTRRWGTTPDRQAVEMDVRFETARETQRDTGKAKTRRRVSVSIVPIGKIPDSAAFELRCLQLMMQLKSYLQSS